jgi:dTDP-4-dehydrorhamnose reductase
MAGGKRMLVTGAGGFLGAHVVEVARAAGYEVIGHLRRPARAAESWLAGVECVLHELADSGELARWLEPLAPLAVVHTAAASRIADCEENPSLARRVNVEASAALARAAARIGARFVHVSTDLVFGAQPAPSGGFVESDTPAPISHYGASKRDAELEVAKADPAAVIARLPLLLGPSHGRGLGASDSILEALARGERPRLFEDELRTPLDVRSAAQALVELAHSPIAGVLHVAGPERMSRYDLGCRVLRRTGLRADQARAALKPTTRAALGVQASRPADVSLNAALARDLLRTLLVGIESGSH